ncbi:MAG: GNAT family N-acetyltransferase [Clostridiaceae bacterium]|jgi:ribosomal protein S18 acetylase RimI-like enzyme|nr:GNAT family N-acetyltransferase [Clostridiaceae bacterium]
MKYLEVKINDAAAIKELSDLAVKILREHYDPIVGVTQNDYMLCKFQSVSSITEQLKNGYIYYFVCDLSGNKLGFLAYYPRKDDMYLSKFYLLKEQRGKGISKDMLQFVIEKTKEAGLSSIVLNVNKKNSAIKAYEKLGFIKIGEEKNDIGNGYFMDDFVYKYCIN